MAFLISLPVFGSETSVIGVGAFVLVLILACVVVVAFSVCVVGLVVGSPPP